MKARHETGTASFSGFARVLGERSASYVTQLKEAGRLVLTEDGKRVRVTESLALIRATADPSKAGVAARHAAARGKGGAGQAPPPAAPPAQAGAPDDGEEPIPASFGDAVQDGHARRRAKALADKAETDAKAAERDYRISLGELLQADHVEHAVRGAVATFRTSLENLPNTVAPELAALTDEGRIRVVLGEALEHALEELSRKLGTIAKAEEA